MPNLNQYLDFSVVLDNSTITPKITLLDTTPYNNINGSGLDLSDSCVGFWEIIQPDGVTVKASFETPDVYPVSGQVFDRITEDSNDRITEDGYTRETSFANAQRVTSVDKELRLGTDSQLQNGVYTFKFNVRCEGYQDSQIIKQFDLAYNTPTIKVTDNINLFVPYIKKVDTTDYSQTDLSIVFINRSWNGVIDSVLGVKETVTSNTSTLDYKYNNKYYDASYSYSLTSIFKLQGGSNNWFAVKGYFVANGVFDVYELATLKELLCFINGEQYIRFFSGCKSCGCNDCVCDQNGVNIEQFVTEINALYVKYCKTSLTHTNNSIPPFDWNGVTSQGSIALAPGTTQWTVPASLILEKVLVLSTTPINFSVGRTAGADDIYATTAVNGNAILAGDTYLVGGNTIYFNGVVSDTVIYLLTRSI